MPWLRDALAVSGYLALVTGLWLVSPALSLIIAGSLLLALGVFSHLTAGRPRLTGTRRVSHAARPPAADRAGQPSDAAR